MKIDLTKLFIIVAALGLSGVSVAAVSTDDQSLTNPTANTVVSQTDDKDKDKDDDKKKKK